MSFGPVPAYPRRRERCPGSPDPGRAPRPRSAHTWLRPGRRSALSSPAHLSSGNTTFAQLPAAGPRQVNYSKRDKENQAADRNRAQACSPPTRRRDLVSDALPTPGSPSASGARPSPAALAHMCDPVRVRAPILQMEKLSPPCHCHSDRQLIY